MYAAKLLLAEVTDDHSHIEDLSNMMKKHSEENELDDDKPKSYRQMMRTETLRSGTTQIVRNSSSDLTDKSKKQETKVRPDDGNSYEAIAIDQNTERKALQHVNLAATPESAASLTVENKEAVFNAYKTIEKLQEQLMQVFKKNLYKCFFYF